MERDKDRETDRIRSIQVPVHESGMTFHQVYDSNFQTTTEDYFVQ